ncbi:RES family NAD+ phosphorylase [Phenylobacterium sp.]|jgi:RES domain-containing protein|uniref:RES family NAD+ phosphorylase n=1 Tax=Phenylobacterium sp. TaxID=1871053 RepID=UPI002E33FF8D|nr:RES family NAD+ phosphorylase [Phenylobacterium sp.]HEX2559506.1 RES family NAD+ phosphorylase [Phenylobacterium sp.]
MSFSRARVRGRTHRLILSRYPTVGVFDDIADDEAELRLAFALEDLTLRTPNRLALLPEGSLPTGPTASIVMAAFLHVADEGGRFHDAALGAWYAARDLSTAIEETVHHNHRRLAASAGGFPARLQLRELVASLDAQLLDLRGAQGAHPELYSPEDYSASQAFARERRWPFAEPPEEGFVYDSVRRAGGECVVLFRPAAVPLPVLQGDHLEYVWDARGELTVLKLTSMARN